MADIKSESYDGSVIEIDDEADEVSSSPLGASSSSRRTAWRSPTPVGSGSIQMPSVPKRVPGQIRTPPAPPPRSNMSPPAARAGSHVLQGTFLVSKLAGKSAKLPVQPIAAHKIREIRDAIKTVSTEIRKTVSSSNSSLDAMDRIIELGIEETAMRMERPEIKVAVVGDAGVRKSIFINLLLFDESDYKSMGFKGDELRQMLKQPEFPLPVGAGPHLTKTFIQVRRGPTWEIFKVGPNFQPDTTKPLFEVFKKRLQQKHLGIGIERPAELVRLILENLNDATDGDLNLQYGWAVEGPFRLPASITLIDTPGWQPEFTDAKLNASVTDNLSNFFRAAPYQGLMVLSMRQNTQNNISALIARKIVVPGRRAPSIVFVWNDDAMRPRESEARACLNQIEAMQVHVFDARDRASTDSLYQYSILISEIEQKVQLFTYSASLPLRRELFAMIEYQVHVEDLIKFTVALRCFAHLCSRTTRSVSNRSESASLAAPPPIEEAPIEFLLSSAERHLFAADDMDPDEVMMELLIECISGDLNRAGSKIFDLVMRARKLIATEIRTLVDRKRIEARGENELQDFWSSSAELLDQKMGEPPSSDEMSRISDATSNLFDQMSVAFSGRDLDELFDNEVTMLTEAGLLRARFWTQFCDIFADFAKNTFTEVMENPEKVFALSKTVSSTSKPEIFFRVQTLYLAAKGDLQLAIGKERSRQPPLELKSNFFIPNLFDPAKFMSEKTIRPHVKSPVSRIKSQLVRLPLDKIHESMDQLHPNYHIMVCESLRLEAVSSQFSHLVATVKCSEKCYQSIQDYINGLQPQSKFRPSPVITWCTARSKRLDLALNGRYIEYLLIVMCDQDDIQSLMESLQSQEKREKARIIFLVCPKSLGIATNATLDICKAIVEHFSFPFWWLVTPTAFGTCREISLAHLGSRDTSLCRALFLVETQVAQQHRNYITDKIKQEIRSIKDKLITFMYEDVAMFKDLKFDRKHCQGDESSSQHLLSTFREIDDVMLNIRSQKHDVMIPENIDQILRDIDMHLTEIRQFVSSLTAISFAPGRTLLDAHAEVYPNFYKRNQMKSLPKICIHSTDSVRDICYSYSSPSTPVPETHSESFYVRLKRNALTTISFHYVGYGETDKVTLCVAFVPLRTTTKEKLRRAITSHPKCSNAEIYVANVPRLCSTTVVMQKAILEDFCKSKYGFRDIKKLTDDRYLYSFMNVNTLNREPPEKTVTETLTVEHINGVVFLMCNLSFESAPVAREDISKIAVPDSEAYISPFNQGSSSSSFA